MEDVSKYPQLECFSSVYVTFLSAHNPPQIAELYKRGWNKYDLAGLTGGNLLRVLEGAEKVSKQLRALHVSRLNKAFHKHLLSPKAALCWKASLKITQLLELLPACPTFLSIPAYANLMYSPQCNVSGSVAQHVTLVDNVIKELSRVGWLWGVLCSR